MSLVIFPVAEERVDVVIRNVMTAAMHPRVEHVLIVAATRGETYRAVTAALPGMRARSRGGMTLLCQERIGMYRSGKGDAMNTGLKFFLRETPFERVHFYDADITNFGMDWLTRAEEVADQGYDMVRYSYPRAVCDAMITWMITRVGFALLWPRSSLPALDQPLAGEIVLTRSASERLIREPRVLRQSDWGIDTVYTFFAAHLEMSVYEMCMPSGKQHKLYGSLLDLRQMVIECFATIQSLQGEDLAGRGEFHPNPTPSLAPEGAQQVGFDLESTLGLIANDWTGRQEQFVYEHLSFISKSVLLNRVQPTFNFMDERVWGTVYESLLGAFVKGDSDWEELLFKLWCMRVLSYTAREALRGYASSREYLGGTIEAYRRGKDRSVERLATGRDSSTATEPRFPEE